MDYNYTKENGVYYEQGDLILKIPPEVTKLYKQGDPAVVEMVNTLRQQMKELGTGESDFIILPSEEDYVLEKVG